MCVSMCVHVTKVIHCRLICIHIRSLTRFAHLCNIISSAVRARDVSIPQSVDLFQVLSGQTNQHHTSTSVIIELRLLFVCLGRGQGKKCPKVDPKMR